MSEDTPVKTRKPQTSLSPSQKMELVRERLKPTAWAEIAAKYDVTDRTARSIFYQWARENEGKNLSDLSGRDPIEIVWESAARYESWIEQLSQIAFAPETQDSNRIGAINAQMSAQGKLTELLQATGILPKQLGKLRIEADVRYVAQQILTVFREEDIPAHVQQRVIGLLRGGSSED